MLDGARELPLDARKGRVRPQNSVPVIRSWSGIDGKMPDKVPVLGPSATTPGLIHAFGFSGHGFQLGLGVGSVLAELIIDGHTEIPIAAFDIRRWMAPVG